MMQSQLEELEREILLRVVQGEDVVSRIRTMKWFTYERDGESYVVGPEMQRRFEALAGVAMVEYTPAAYPMDLALGFRPGDMPRVTAALAAAGLHLPTQKGRS